MILWIQERSDLPPTQASEIFYSYFNGQSFSSPTAIRFDTRADFQPVIAYHHSGNWLAAWTRVRDPSLTTTGDPQADALAQSRQLQPVYSIFNPNNQSWSDPINIPDINVNVNILETGSSYMLTIANDPENELALLWLTNYEQDVFPYDIEAQTFSSSNYVYWSLFDGNQFNLTGTLRQGSRTRFLAMDLTGSFNGEELLIGFNEPWGNYASPTFFIYRSITPTNSFTSFERPPSSNIFLQGGGHKIQVLNDGRIALVAADQNRLRVRYGSQWDQLNNGGQLYEDKINPLNTCDFYGCSSEFRDSFVLGETQDGEIYTVIPEIRNSNPDFILAIEDPNVAPASLNGLFEGGTIAEKYMSSAINSEGDLVLFYYQANLLKDRVYVDLGDGDGEQEFFRTREPSTGKIMMAIHEINTDLTVKNVNHTNGLSEQGHQATAYATVFNTGDKAIENPKISLFARDIGPDLDQTNTKKYVKGADITLAEYIFAKDGWLAAGDKVEVTVPWILPDDTNYQIYAIVDPMNEVDEYNEQDNQGDGPKADFIYANGFDSN
jgi:hypothetical protein